MIFQYKIRENRAERRRVYFHLVDATDGITAETGEAGGQPKISKNGNPPANTTNTLTSVDQTNLPGLYYMELTGAELDTYGFIVVRYKSANVAEYQVIGQVLDYDPYEIPQRGGGWSPDIDYKRIKKIIGEEVAKTPKIDVPKPTKVSFTPILAAIRTLNDNLKEIPHVDQKVLIDKFNDVLGAVKNIRIPQPEKTDLSPIIEKIDEIDLDVLFDKYVDKSNTEEYQRAKQVVETTLEKIKSLYLDDIEMIKRYFTEIKKALDKMPVVMVAPPQTRPLSRLKY